VAGEGKPEAAAPDAEVDSKNDHGDPKSQSKETAPPEPGVEAKPGLKIENGGPGPDTAASASDLGAELKKAEPVLDVKGSEPETGSVEKETEAEEGKSATEIASSKSDPKVADASPEPGPSVETAAAEPAGSIASEEPTVGEPVVEEASTPLLDKEPGLRADPIGTGPNAHETESSQPTQDKSVLEVQELDSKDLAETTALEAKPEVEDAQTEPEIAPAQVNDQAGGPNPKSDVEVTELPSETERSDANLEVGHANGDPAFNNDNSLPANDPGPQKDEGDGVPRLLPKGPIEALKQEFAVSDSGRSTPAYARTAAEVADSAALLDEEEPYPDIPDDEAGRLGVRRLSSTPIPKVAQTAAEVADSAMFLDHDDDDVSSLGRLVAMLMLISV